MNEEEKFKFNYILESYKNTENTIRFADIKAGAVVAFHTLLLSLILKDYPINILKYLSDIQLNSIIFITFKVFIIIIIVLYICCTYKALASVYNAIIPREQAISKKYQTNNMFWANDLCKKIESNSLDNVKNEFELVKPINLIGDIFYEHAKVSKIAEQKMKSIKKAIIYTKYSFFCWILIIIFGMIITNF